jgi:hypothetical protein
MSRKKKVVYPPSRSSKGPPPVYVPPVTPPSVAVINRQAISGKDGIAIGSRVVINGTGLYTGETAIVESLGGGVIPAALVRTEAGLTRRVRTVDLTLVPPAPRASPDPKPEPDPEA